MAQTLTRRAWLRRSVATASGILGAALLAACGSTTATTGSATSAAAQAPASTVVITQTAVQTVTVASVQTVTQTAVQTVTQTAVQTVTVSASAPAVKAIALDFWNPAGDTNGKAIIADLVNKWNDQNPTLPVKDTVVDNNNDYEKYTAALAGGAPPDTIMTYDYDPLPGWAYGDAILPMDPYAAEMKISQGDYFPIVWPMMSFKGHIWGFLQEFDSELYGWNKDLFAKNGLDANNPPKTIAELDDLNAKLTQRDSAGAITQLGIAPGYGGVRGGGDSTWVAVFGGMYYDTLKQEFTITKPENAAALDWMAGWWKKLGGRAVLDAYSKAVGGAGGLGNGKQGMGIVTSHIPFDWKKQYPSLNLETAQTPTNNGTFYGTASAGGGNLFCVPKGVPHPKESVTFIKYMASPESVTAWDVRERNMPPVKSVALGADFAQQAPDMHAFLEMLKLNATDNHITGPVVHPVVNEFNKLKGTMVNDILDGKYPAQQGLQQLDTQVKAALSKYK